MKHWLYLYWNRIWCLKRAWWRNCCTLSDMRAILVFNELNLGTRRYSHLLPWRGGGCSCWFGPGLQCVVFLILSFRYHFWRQHVGNLRIKLVYIKIKRDLFIPLHFWYQYHRCPNLTSHHQIQLNRNCESFIFGISVNLNDIATWLISGGLLAFSRCFRILG